MTEAEQGALTCYVFEGWAPRIRPATSRRDWMDATTERFAYRCLPLAIANSHGWEVLSPVSFEARWNGGDSTDAVEIRAAPGSPAHQLPVSLFGYGTLTFHLEGILRTPPGWNLFVTGSPNSHKDGIQALSGIIETDWSPYSFTMNWRFTRAGEWIRFEENEPFAFFFPVERGSAERFAPKIAPITDDPELAAQFSAWSASRDAFHKMVAQTPPSEPSDKWQKLYYRGLDAHGQPGAPDHQPKLRLTPFALPDGGVLQPGEMAACPVSHAAARQPDPVAPGRDRLELARRNWLLDVQQRQRRLAEPTGNLDEVSAINGAGFLYQYYSQSRPVVIRGALRDWPAVRHWNPAYLVERVGSAEVEYQGGRTANENFELYKDQHKSTIPFDRFIAAVTENGYGNDAYITAYNSAANARALAPLTADLLYLDDYLTREHGMMWIGPLGTFTPLHFDLTNNLFAQIVGAKKFILVPPSETPRIANERHVFSEVRDIVDEDRLALYPAARDAITYEVTVEAGDLLYLPIGWWHQVTALDFSVSLTYTNFLWPNDAYVTFPADP